MYIFIVAAAIKCFNFHEKGNKVLYTLSGNGSSTDAIAVFKNTISKNLNKDMHSKPVRELIQWISRLLLIDDKVKEYRKNLFADIVGDEFANLFSEYYNQVSGNTSDVIDIQAIRNPENIKKFVSFEMNFHYQSGAYKWSEIVQTAFNLFKKEYADIHYLKLILACIEYDIKSAGGAVENSRHELKNILSIKDIEDVIKRLEFLIPLPKEYVKLLKLLKYSSTEYDQVAGQGFVGDALY